QPARVVDHFQDSAVDGRKLDDLLGKDEAYLNALIAVHMQEYELRLFRMPEQDGDPELTASLFYPQNGLIGFPLFHDPTKKMESVTAGHGLPLHPQILMTMLPKTVYEPWLSAARKMFQAFSVGLADDCRKV